MTDSTLSTNQTKEVEANCIVCGISITPGTGAGCKRHRTEAQELVALFGSGVPGDGENDGTEPFLPFTI